MIADGFDAPRIVGISFRFSHTSENEQFHSLRLSYWPKRVSYRFEGAEVRGMVATIDHNHHIHRGYLCNQDGERRRHRVFQQRSGRFDIKDVKEPKSYSYECRILGLVMQLAMGAEVSARAKCASYDPVALAPTIGGIPPSTADLVNSHISRL